MNGNLTLELTPSFCNYWPLISIEINNKICWENSVDHKQTVVLDFELLDENQVVVRYLNKRSGPEFWDTQIDEHGNITQDQNCIVSNIKLCHSRCDFLIDQLVLYGADGSINKTRGFMSWQGYIEFKFPGTVYTWIIEQRRKGSTQTRQSSSLDYWTNYVGNATDPVTDNIIIEIKELLNRI